MKKKFHIGTLIRKQLEYQERSGAWLARKINTDPSNISKILNKEHLDTELLVKISIALNHNFFQYYTQYYNCQLSE